MPIKQKSRPTKVISGVPDFKDAKGLWGKRATTTEDGFYVQRSSRAISLWESLHRRIAKQADYADVTCGFENFQEFAEWCQTQPGYKAVDAKGQPYELDKDLLSSASRCYSKETCCFVPRYVNGMFITSGKLRGPWPIGVFLNKPKGKFQAKGSVRGKSVYLGIHKTAIAAHVQWQKHRATRLRELYEEYSTDQYATPRVLEAIALRIIALEKDIIYGKETVAL